MLTGERVEERMLTNLGHRSNMTDYTGHKVVDLSVQFNYKIKGTR